jgi:peptidoglycan hydrolase-like protein with peptidoglycan-binding domain
MLLPRYVLQHDFTCACDLAAAPGGAGAGRLLLLSAPVGDAPAPRCPNRPDDVRAVQTALNAFAAHEGGPPAPLAVDGVCGTRTRKAIRAFQRHWNPRGTPEQAERDGVVDPEGPTIRRLRAGTAGGRSHAADLRLRAVRPRVLAVLTSARAALGAALARYRRGWQPDAGLVAAGVLPAGDGAVERVERHFHAGQTRQPDARVARVDAVFQAMQAVLSLTATGVVAVPAAPADVPDGAIAAAWGGAFHAGQAAGRAGPHAAHGPVGVLHLLPAAGVVAHDDALAYALVHALAHHVGPALAPIVDLAYAHQAPDAYAALGPAGALRNADSYAQFAFDAGGRPGFDPRDPDAGPITAPYLPEEVAPAAVAPAAEPAAEAPGVGLTGPADATARRAGALAAA